MRHTTTLTHAPRAQPVPLFMTPHEAEVRRLELILNRLVVTAERMLEGAPGGAEMLRLRIETAKEALL